VCDEVLARSFACDWDDIPDPACAIELGGEEGLPLPVAGASPGTGQPPAIGYTTLDPDAAVVATGEAVVAVSTPVVAGVATHGGMTTARGFDREATPRTLQDVAMLETVREEDEGEDGGNDTFGGGRCGGGGRGLAANQPASMMMPYAQFQSGLHSQHQLFGNTSPGVLNAPLPGGLPHTHGRRMGQHV